MLSDKDELLEKFKKKTKVLEMIVSFGFLATGIYLMTRLPEINMFLIIKIALVLASIPLAVVGYKKKNKVLATLSFFLIIVAFGLAQKAKNASYLLSIPLLSCLNLRNSLIIALSFINSTLLFNKNNFIAK